MVARQATKQNQVQEEQQKMWEILKHLRTPQIIGNSLPTGLNRVQGLGILSLIMENQVEKIM